MPLRNNSMAKQNDIDCPSSNSIGRASFGGQSGHEPIRRISSCQDFGGQLAGIPTSQSFHLDPLFQIDENKKYLGFLEESTDEEKSNSDQEIERIDQNEDETAKSMTSSESDDEGC